eukprot:4521073-Prymnesium_polylepis.1
MFERAGKSKPFFLSGGGETCQFAYGEPVHMCSLDAPMKEMEQKMRETGYAALSEARAHFETVVDAWWPSSGLPPQLVGSFVGIEMHQDAVSGSRLHSRSTLKALRQVGIKSRATRRRVWRRRSSAFTARSSRHLRSSPRSTRLRRTCSRSLAT